MGMFTFKAWFCFETLCRSQMPRQLVLKKMCQQTCHTHLRCQLPPEAESSLKTRDFRGCPAPTCLCQEPGRLRFVLPSSCPLLASCPHPVGTGPGLACPQQPLSTSSCTPAGPGSPPPSCAFRGTLSRTPCLWDAPQFPPTSEAKPLVVRLLLL